MKMTIKLPRLVVRLGDNVSLLYVLFVTIEIGTFMLRSSFLVRNLGLMAVGFMCICYSLTKNGIYKNKSYICFVILYTACGVISFVVNKNSDIQELLWPCAYMGLGLLLLNFRMPFKTAKWVYILVSLTFVVSIILAGSVDNLALQSSRNSVSIYQLQLWSIYMISAYENKEDTEYWSILLGLFVSVLSIGRGGILTFLAMLAVYMLFQYKQGNSKFAGATKLAAYIVLFVLGVVLIWLTYFEFISQTIDNFRLRGLDSKRLLLWVEYIENVKLDVIYLLFGAPQRGSFWLDRYADNLHNSFLQLHAKYGLIMLLWVLGALAHRIVYFIKRKQMYLFVPLLGLLIRMNLDYTNFNGVLDVILVYFLFCSKYERLKS